MKIRKKLSRHSSQLRKPLTFEQRILRFTIFASLAVQAFAAKNSTSDFNQY